MHCSSLLGGVMSRPQVLAAIVQPNLPDLLTNTIYNANSVVLPTIQFRYKLLGHLIFIWANVKRLAIDVNRPSMDGQIGESFSKSLALNFCQFIS